jgi:hypothetical protein
MLLIAALQNKILIIQEPEWRVLLLHLSLKLPRTRGLVEQEELLLENVSDYILLGLSKMNWRIILFPRYKEQI